MGARDWHVARAEHHLEVAEYLAPVHVDWAAVALFYSAHQWVHSSLADEASLSKDERHPRKHTGKGGPTMSGRGTNQLVRDLYSGIRVDYISLFEASHRTRYDHGRLGRAFYDQLVNQHDRVRHFCTSLNGTRAKIPTQAP